MHKGRRLGVAATIAVSVGAALLVVAEPAQAIIGGVPANGVDFFVQVSTLFDDNQISECGGSLIGDGWVLTAAHCMFHDDHQRVGLPGVKPVGYGSVDVVGLVINPLYHEGDDHNAHDLALLKLNPNLPIASVPVQVGAPWDPGAYAPGTPARIMGTGKTSPGDTAIVNPLTTVDTAIQPDSYMSNIYDPWYWFTLWDGAYMLGAGNPLHTVCKGDSGSPLVVFRGPDNHPVEVGAAAFTRSDDCNTAGVFTRLSDAQLAWVATVAPTVTTRWGRCVASDGTTGVSVARYTPQVIPGDARDGDFYWDISCTHPPLAGPMSDIAAASNGDGRVEVFGQGTTSDIYHNGETSPGGSLSGWLQLDGRATAIAATRDAFGKLELFVADTAGLYYRRSQLAVGGPWTIWQRDSGVVTSLAATSNTDGRVEVFATNGSGQVFHRWETSAGGDWTDWQQFDGQLVRVAAARNGDGRLELFGVNSSFNVYHRWQLTPGGNWSSWVQMDGGLTDIAAATDADGRIELFGTNLAGDVYHRWQISPGNPWSAWTPLSGNVSRLDAAINGNRLLELYGVNAAGQVYRTTQLSPGGTSWSDWSLVSTLPNFTAPGPPKPRR